MLRQLALAGFLLPLFIATTATAQDVPWTVTHQGVLTADDGSAATGPHDITFTVYDASTGGAVVWEDTVNATLSDTGFFSVVLGGAANPLDMDVFTGEGRFLAMSVDGGAEMSPRLEITSAPYAVRAGQAAAVADGGVTAQALATGAVTADKLAAVPWSKLINVPAGLADGDDDSLAALGASCASGDLPQWDGTMWNCAAGAAGYNDANAVAAMGAAANGNTLNHSRYTNAEAVSAMGALGNGNPLNHNRATYQAGSGLTLFGSTFSANARGVTYERWGRNDCPGSAQVVYTGYAASGAYDHGGGISSLHCLHGQPNWPGGLSDANQNGALLYGTEFQTSGYGIAAITGLHDRDATCAVCLQPNADMQIMIPGRISCPAGWNPEYSGYLMGTHYTQSSTHDAACVATNATASGSAADNNGNLWYPTETECGSLPCAPYVQNREVGCVVCTR